MELTGHSGEVFCAKFDPNGNYIASGSMDRSISVFINFQPLKSSVDILQCFGGLMAIAITMVL